MFWGSSVVLCSFEAVMEVKRSCLNAPVSDSGLGAGFSAQDAGNAPKWLVYLLHNVMISITTKNIDITTLKYQISFNKPLHEWQHQSFAIILSFNQLVPSAIEGSIQFLAAKLLN